MEVQKDEETAAAAAIATEAENENVSKGSASKPHGRKRSVHEAYDTPDEVTSRLIC